MIRSYLQILQDSLEKKLKLLIAIEEKSLKQAEMLKNSEVNLAAVDTNMDEKAELIDKILSLDEGFESIYAKIREQLTLNKEQYKDEIKAIKSMIVKVTEKSASIQAIEARNKAQMEVVFSSQKRALQNRRSAMSVARDYYQNMNKVKHVSPQFLDQKK